MLPCQANRGVGFVYCAVGVYTQSMFLNARAIAKSGGAGISGFCIDFIEHNHG
jgi:hypothetical protein